MSRIVNPSEWRVTDVIAPPADGPAHAIAEMHAIHYPGGWVIKCLVGERDGMPILLDLRLQRVPPAPGADTDDAVTGRLLHTIPVGRLIGEMVARVAAQRRRRPRRAPGSVPPPEDAFLERMARGRRLMDEADAEAIRSLPATSPKRGPKGTSDADHRRLANALLELQDADPKHVVMRLADQEEIHEETMRSRVKNAVKNGYLTSRGAGAEGYLPGPRLMESSRRRRQ